MGKVYVAQSKLKFIVDLATNITGAVVKLKYRKPDKTTDEFSVIPSDEVNGIVSYEVTSDAVFDMKGTWTFWSHVTYGDGKVAQGEPFTVKFYEEGR